MAFFDKVKQGFDAASKKTSEVIETTKLNSAIRGEKEAIEEVFRQIGKVSFEKYVATGAGGEEYLGFFQTIQGHQAKIADLELKLDELKNVKDCPNCHAENPREVLFCSKCGYRFEAPQTPPPSGE
ncbi:MAG: zinc ribbon domain-containing protein [Clostridia bacterium]|nr:zinc ribbon domain-containing protein [Clostridia bacterium]